MTAAHCNDWCGPGSHHMHPCAAVAGPLKRCIVHDQSYTRVCTGCAADEKAAS